MDLVKIIQNTEVFRRVDRKYLLCLLDQCIFDPNLKCGRLVIFLYIVLEEKRASKRKEHYASKRCSNV
jgi:hypothetical protein